MIEMPLPGCEKVILLGVILAVNGCGGGTGTVRGTVLFDNERLPIVYNGQPVVPYRVVFFKEDGGLTGTCPVEIDGTYCVANVPTGRVKIIVEPDPEPLIKNPAGIPPGERQSPPRPGGKRVGSQKKSTAAPTLEIIPDRYKLREKSDLSYKVKSGTQTFDIELSSKP